MKRFAFLVSILVLLSLACSLGGELTPTPPGTPPEETLIPPAQAAPADDCSAGAPGQHTPLYDHQIFLLFTQDALRLEGEGDLILKHASVPDLVIGPDGALWVYFVNGEPGKHGIFAARQTENKTWEVIDCVKLDGKFNGNAVDPDVTRLADGRIKLIYFEGNFVEGGHLGPNDPHPIFSAISEDGLHFTVEGQLIAVPHATDPSKVQLPDGSWLMAMAADEKTLFAASDDGHTFHLTDVSLEGKGIPELALLPDGRIVLYQEQIYLSADKGQTWERLSGGFAGGGYDPSLVTLPQGGYAFAYKKIEGNMTSAGQPGPLPAVNPFENLTTEQETCLKAAWGETVFEEISGFRRPPTQEEAAAMTSCGLQTPPGGPVNGAGPFQMGNPQDVVLNLDVTARYLMAFHVCDTSVSDCSWPHNHRVSLAQSDDGVQWSLVPGWQPYPGSVPDVIRRGETLYIYTPDRLTRYHMDTGVLEASVPVTIEGLSDDGFVDPSLYLDDNGRLVLFFLYSQIGGDPASCQPQENACEKRFGSATEVEGSDGARFTLDEGDRAVVAIGADSGLRTASDPDIFFDGAQYVLYIAHGASTSVWTSPELRGTYTQVAELPGGLLNTETGGVASGYFDSLSGQYWTYGHVPRKDQATPIRRAVHADLLHPLSESDWSVVISGTMLGLTSTTNVESASITLNAP